MFWSSNYHCYQFYDNHVFGGNIVNESCSCFTGVHIVEPRLTATSLLRALSVGQKRKAQRVIFLSVNSPPALTFNKDFGVRLTGFHCI